MLLVHGRADGGTPLTRIAHALGLLMERLLTTNVGLLLTSHWCHQVWLESDDAST